MSDDLLITPGSRKLEIKDSSGNVDAKIETDASGNLQITNAGGDIAIGDTTSDIFVGDGTNNVDIVFEQDGEIRGTSGVTVTLGASGSNVRMASDLNLNGNDITGVGDLTLTGNLTITGDINTVSTTDLDVLDKTITVGVGQGETNSGGSGLIVSGSGASLLWDQSDSAWDFNKNVKVAGSLGVTNIVTNKVVKFNGTFLDDSNITDTGSLITLGSATSVSGGAFTVNSEGDAINILSTSNTSTRTGIKFNTVADGTQNGRITYSHKDGQSYGSGASFVLGSDQSTTTILADGKLMYDEGIYSKPSSGTGAGTRKDENWDTAYGDKINSAAFSGTTTKTLTLTRQDGGTVTASFTDLSGGTDTNYYLDGISKSGNTLTFSVNGATDQTYTFGSNAFNSTTIPTSQQITATSLSSSNDLGSGTAGAFGNGWYSWGNSQPSNAPENYAIMFELNDGGQPQQWVMAYGNTANNVDLYARRRTGGTWDSTWTQFWSSNDFSSTNVSNWNTAYGWGDHASGGYAPTASPTFTGEVTLPNKIIHSGDTNTYLQFHAADQFRVVAGGNEITEWRSDRMQMNNKSITFPVWNNFADTSLSDIAYNSLNAPIHITSTGVGNTDKYLPILQGSATHDQGYRTSYVLGGFKKATTGAAWGDGHTGFFMAMGNNDSYPTKEFRFTWDGRIWYTDAGSSTYLDFDTSNTIKFVASGSTRMSVTSGGVTLGDNLGLAGNQLENVGNAYFNEYLYHNGDTDTYIRFEANSMKFRTGGDDRLQVQNDTVTVNANLDLKAESDTGTNSIFLPRDGRITFYGNTALDHSISSKNQAQSATDDLRFSSYGSMYFNLDSNSNNTSTADFVVSRHNHATNKLFQIDGETGAGKGMHSYPNEGADGVSLMSYTHGTVPIAQGVVQIRSTGKTGWDDGDEMGSIDFYNNDGSGIGARTHARIVAVNRQGNGSTTTTFNSNIQFYTSEYNTALQTVPALTIEDDNSVSVGNGSDAASCLKIMPADDGTSDDLQFYNGTTRMGEIGTQDTSWLRINQHTGKNIYTPRYIRADNGFFVDGSSKGINGSGNFVGGTIAGASDANVSNWDTAYGWGDHANGGYLTSHQDISGKANLSGATFTGNITVQGNVYARYYDVDAGDGRGMRLWNGSENYKVYMSQDGASGAGRVPGETTSDYNMYFRMSGGTNRGFAFQSSTGTPHTGIDSIGNIRTIGDIHIGSDSAGDNFLYIDKVATGQNGIIFKNGGNSKCKIIQDSSEFLQIYTNNAQAMEINEAGDVNITKDNAVLKFGTPGNGQNVNGCWLSFEGNTGTDGEGSGRLFFREHNSTTGSMDAYGMSLGYRGGDTSVTTAGGNTWTGLGNIGNGQWGMWGHNGDNTGALIMYGDRAGTFVDFAGNNVQGVNDLYIADQIFHTGDTNTYMQFHAADQWRVVTGGSERLECNSTATTVTGTLHVTGDVIAYYSSDRRLKNNITPIVNPMEKISKISGNTFEWNNNQDTYEEGTKDVGLIAQEVEEILPELVQTKDDGYKAVKYEKMIALLIEGMKEMQAEIDELKQKVK